MLLAPPPIVGHGVEGPEGSVIQHGLVRMDERVSHPLSERSPGGGLEVSQEIGGDGLPIRKLGLSIHA